MGNSGAVLASLARTPRNGYFTIVADETSSTARPIISVKDMTKLVRVLKSDPRALRKDLEFNQEGHRSLEDAMLDRAVRTMLLTESSIPRTPRRAIFHPRWKMDESLESFIRRVYPKDPRFHSDDHSPIQSTKLSAGYFQRRPVQLKIVWTRFLADHLILTDNNKTLHVFGYPGFLQTGLLAVPPGNSDDSFASTLRRYDEAIHRISNTLMLTIIPEVVSHINYWQRQCGLMILFSPPMIVGPNRG